MRTYARRMATNNRHGEAGSRLYKVWAAMIGRCVNPRSKNYRHYGGRGIRVCDRWLLSFANFKSDMGNPPDDTTLDRINNDGPYSPENCRWATRSTQSRNTTANHWITHQGLTLTLADWSARTGLQRETIRRRLASGWSVQSALETSTQEFASMIVACTKCGRHFKAGAPLGKHKKSCDRT